MKYNKVIEARFLSRPNRFVAQVEVAGHEENVWPSPMHLDT